MGRLSVALVAEAAFACRLPARALALALLLLAGCSSSLLRQPISDEFPPATPAEISQVHAPEALRADLDGVVGLHERACPAPYLHAERSQVLAACERLKARIDRPMTRREFLPLLMELQASYRVDHVIQTVPSEDLDAWLDGGGRILPFRARPDGAELLVVAVSGGEEGLAPGDRVQAIGGQPASEIISRLQSLVPAESPVFQARRIATSFRGLMWALGVDPPLAVTVRRPDGGVAELRVDGVGRGSGSGERTLTATAAPPATTTPAAASAAPAAPPEVLVDAAPFRCLLRADGIGVIVFPTMNTTLAEQWERFLDASMAALAAKRASGLVVDLRGNGGGDSNLGVALLRRVTDLPYRFTAAVVWRKSREGVRTIECSVRPAWRWLIPIGLTLGMPGYAGAEWGSDLTERYEPERHGRASPGFDGPACLLIGSGTFSSAMMLADGVRTYDLMPTVGAPTGGLPTSLGELGFARLPASGLVVQFCQKQFLRASGDPLDLGPVVPLVPVDESAGPDAAMERAAALLRAAKPGTEPRPSRPL